MIREIDVWNSLRMVFPADALRLVMILDTSAGTFPFATSSNEVLNLGENIYVTSSQQVHILVKHLHYVKNPSCFLLQCQNGTVNS